MADIQERYRKEEARRIRTVIDIASSILARYENTEDPVIRYTLFLDKFCILLDVLFGAISHRLEEACAEEDRAKALDLVKRLQTEMQALQRWIQRPAEARSAGLACSLLTEDH